MNKAEIQVWVGFGGWFEVLGFFFFLFQLLSFETIFDKMQIYVTVLTVLACNLQDFAAIPP